jgi:hypothetical protein
MIDNTTKAEAVDAVTFERTVSADIFCAEITAGKSQRLKEITTVVGKSKHEF